MINVICMHCNDCELNVQGVCHAGEECTCMDCAALKRAISCNHGAKVNCWVTEEEYYCGD